MSDTGRIVVLIRHSIPEVDPSRPASEWPLNEEGIERCEDIASQLERFLPAAIFASPETKAIETARYIGSHLGIGFSVRERLREHRRPATFLPQSEFHENIRRLFESPDSIVYGSESSNGVAKRIEADIRRVLAERPDGNILMVTHGTAMSSFIARHVNADAYSVWESLDLPSYIALGVPSFDIVDCGGVDRGLFHMTDTGVDT